MFDRKNKMKVMFRDEILCRTKKRSHMKENEIIVFSLNDLLDDLRNFRSNSKYSFKKHDNSNDRKFSLRAKESNVRDDDLFFEKTNSICLCKLSN